MWAWLSFSLLSQHFIIIIFLFFFFLAYYHTSSEFWFDSLPAQLISLSVSGATSSCSRMTHQDSWQYDGTRHEYDITRHYGNPYVRGYWTGNTMGLGSGAHRPSLTYSNLSVPTKWRHLPAHPEHQLTSHSESIRSVGFNSSSRTTDPFAGPFSGIPANPLYNRSTFPDFYSATSSSPMVQYSAVKKSSAGRKPKEEVRNQERSSQLSL